MVCTNLRNRLLKRADTVDLIHRKLESNMLQKLRCVTLLILAAALVASQLVAAEPPSEYTNSVGMKFTLIPPGSFLMGTPGERQSEFSEEYPQHRVQITKAFKFIQVGTVGEAREICAGIQPPFYRKGSSFPPNYAQTISSVLTYRPGGVIPFVLRVDSGTPHY